MKPLVQLSLAASLCALVSVPVLAQNAARKLDDKFFLGLAQAEPVDAVAQTISISRAELGGGALLDENGLVLEDDPVSYKLSPSFRADRLEHGVVASDLKLGDTVWLIQPNSDGTRRAPPPQLPVEGWIDANRYSSGSQWTDVIGMKVISLSPLLLRSGDLPDGTNFENGRKSPVTYGSEKTRIGTLWSGTGRQDEVHRTYLKLDLSGKVIPTSWERTFTSAIQLDKLDGLQFDRQTPTNLFAIASDLAAGKVILRAKLEFYGKQRVELLLVLNKK